MAFASRLLISILISSLSANLFCSGSIICEDLPTDVCVFAISGTGNRCLLETMAMENKGVELQCKMSEVKVEDEKMVNYIETDRCIKACGTDRNTVGISSDALLEPGFTSMLCSPSCFLNCPSIVDLYSNLASSEGVSLKELCKNRRSSARRAMTQILSSGGAAPGPAGAESLMNSKILAEAPAPSIV